MKIFFLLLTIMVCLAGYTSCTSKAENKKQDQILCQTLDTLTCLTGNIYIINGPDVRSYLFDRLREAKANVNFGTHSFNVNKSDYNGEQIYVLTNPSVTYSLCIMVKNTQATPAGGTVQQMKITKLCSK